MITGLKSFNLSRTENRVGYFSLMIFIRRSELSQTTLLTGRTEVVNKRCFYLSC